MTATLKVDTIKEVNSSVNNLVLDSSGNVTVGNNLTVTGTTTFTGGQTFTGAATFNSTSTFNGTLTLNTPSTTTARNINWSNGTGTVATVAGYSDSTTTGHLEFYTLQSGTSPTEQMRIDQYGSLLVGTTTSPTTTTGLGTISTPGTVVMGSSFLRNRIINGNMAIDQRKAGASQTFTAGTSGYTTDRWLMGYAVGGSAIVQRVAGPNTYDYALQVQPQTGNTQTNIEQRIEYVNTYGLSGNSVTISGKVYVDSTASGSAQIFYYYSATNGAASTYVSLGTVTLTAGQYVSFSKTFTCPTLYPATASDTSSTGLGVLLEMDNSAGRTFKWTDIQCEVGSVATPFERELYNVTLAKCQRYYQQWGGNTSNERIGNCFAYSGSQARADMVLVVTMRAAPTLTYSAVGDWAIEGAFGVAACTAIALDQASPRIASANLSATVTSGQGAHVMANSTGNARFNLSAEL